MNIEQITEHIRNRPYMSGVDRTEQRKKSLQEIFTTDKVLREFDKLDNQYFKSPDQPFVDPCCGDGSLLGEALIRKVKHGISFETALSQLYGCDIEQSNVNATKERLLCGRIDLTHILDKNIFCWDALTYHMKWDGTEGFNNETHFNNLFEYGEEIA
jgi:hypothetical protein|tara:strand:+ start:2739 stop:3209 length:471 start_codon:yes stop_codon:yes gene_type:complete